MLHLIRSISFLHLASAQGLYFLITGLWPLFHIESFVAVTGPKTDIWLVKTVGLLLAITGAVLLSASLRRKISQEVFTLAVGNAIVLAGIEVVYVGIGRISAIYILDALVEVALVGMWAFCLFNRLGSREGKSPFDC